MAKTCLQVLGYIICLASWGATIGVLLSRKWSSYTSEGIQHSVLDTTQNTEGLWNYCQTVPTGQVVCFPYSGPLYKLPGTILACRILLIFSIILGIVAGVLAMLGFKCITLGPNNQTSKSKVTFLSGLMFMVSAISVTAASCSYIYNVLNRQPKIDPRGKPSVYQLQEAVKISLAFGLFWIVGSFVQMWGSWYNVYESSGGRYSIKGVKKEYV